MPDIRLATTLTDAGVTFDIELLAALDELGASLCWHSLRGDQLAQDTFVNSLVKYINLLVARGLLDNAQVT